MRIETLDGLPDELDDVVRRCPWASFYHTRAWIESLAHSFPQWELRCLVAREANDVVGYLPFFVTRRGPVQACWSLPFGTYGGPVAIEEGSVESRLVETFLDARRRFSMYEVGLVDFLNRVTLPHVAVEAAVTHVIDLDDGFQVLWDKRFDNTKRSETRRAERDGIRVTEATSLGEVREYYSIYEKRSVEWKKRFRYPEALFVELVQRGQGSVRLFLARSGDALLGGHLNFYFGDTATVWHAVATRDSRRLQAGTLLYTSCIRHACENGYKRFNLGGSLGKESLMYYKQSLGGVPFSYRILRWRSLWAKIVSMTGMRSRVR